MLKKRVIASLVVRGGIVVQSIGFRRYLPVGRAEIAVEFLNAWGIDEIVLLDMDATREGRLVSLDLIRDVSRRCFVPLTVGGGIRSVEDMKSVIQSGADKVAINSAAVRNPHLLAEAAGVFGRQCVVVSIDARRSAGGYEVCTGSGRVPTGLAPGSFAARCQELGAGEIYINSIDNDGMKRGYDLELAAQVAASVTIPVILCGGAGHAGHLAEGLKTEGVAAVAAGNFFHYTEHSVTVAKAFLEKSSPQAVRLESYAHYREFGFDPDLRLDRKGDDELAELLFEYHPKEVI